jgi:predicted alpha/beta hydrolase
VTAPVLAYSFEDDAMLDRRAIDGLHAFYRNARIERRHVEPGSAGRKRIGHFGFFVPESRDNLWRDTLDWLRRNAGA